MRTIVRKNLNPKKKKKFGFVGEGGVGGVVGR